MCFARWIGTLLLLAACQADVVSKAPADEEWVCHVSALAWEGMLDGTDEPCVAEDLGEHEFCFVWLEVHVQPVAVDVSTGAVEMMACFFGEVSYNDAGAPMTETMAEMAGGLVLFLETGMSFVNTEDGAGACVGLTAGIDELDNGFTLFSEDSFWWQNGVTSDQEHESASGEWAVSGELFLGVPAFAAPLIDASVVSMFESDTRYWEEAECSATDGS